MIRNVYDKFIFTYSIIHIHDKIRLRAFNMYTCQLRLREYVKV